VRIDQAEITDSPRRPGWVRLAASVHYEGADAGAETVWFEVPTAHAQSLHLSGDSFVSCLAPLAAQRHERMQLVSPTDRLLRDGVQEVTRVWRSWYPQMRDVAIDAPRAIDPACDPAPSPRRTASFFSGGVDSFFTALRHDAGEGTPSTHSIDDLILVHGFDIPLANERAFANVEGSLQRAADDMGKRLVTVATNIRETRFSVTDWPALSHGAALASVAHALGTGYHTVLIGSSAGYRDLRFWGSHPLTDPMLSSSSTRVLHDGAAFMRVEKTEYVARSALAMRHLRVCYLSDDGSNCGRCNNCYRTMLALDALGVLDECATFSRSTLDLHRAGRIFCRYDFDFRQFGYVLDLARHHNRPDIVAAVERSISDSRRLHQKLRILQWLRDKPWFRGRVRGWERALMRDWM